MEAFGRRASGADLEQQERDVAPLRLGSRHAGRRIRRWLARAPLLVPRAARAELRPPPRLLDRRPGGVALPRLERGAEARLEGEPAELRGLPQRVHQRRDLGAAHPVPLRVEHLDEGLVELPGVLVAILLERRHRAPDDLREIVRDALGDLFERLHHAGSDAPQGLVGALGLEGVLPGDGLVDDRAEGEEIRKRGDGLTTRLLRRHVGVLPLQHAGFGLRLHGGPRLGNAEIRELDLTLVADEHVVGRDVAVDDVQWPMLCVSAAVGVVETFRDFGADVDG